MNKPDADVTTVPANSHGAAQPVQSAHAGSTETREEMDTPNENDWVAGAASVLRRVTKAKTRFSAAMKINRVTTLAAADELHAATIEAMVWVMDNDCPEAHVAGRVALMLNSCAEVAHTARRAIVHPSGNPEVVLERLNNLLAIVDLRPQSLTAY
jgi:hypothetical protein